MTVFYLNILSSGIRASPFHVLSMVKHMQLL